MVFATPAPFVLERDLFHSRNPPTPPATISINTTATPINSPALLFEGGGATTATFGISGVGLGTCGTVTIDVSLDGALPTGARPDLNVDGVVQLERLTNVLHTGRPSIGESNAMITMFRLDPDGKSATRVGVKLGRVSASAVEIVQGLKEGDRVILSDLTLPDNTERIRLK